MPRRSDSAARPSADGAVVAQAPDPAGGNAMGAEGGAHGSRHMVAPLGPIETGLAEHAPPLPSPLKVEPEAAEERSPARRHLAAALAERDVALRLKRVGDDDAEPAREMVVAGACRRERRIDPAQA